MLPALAFGEFMKAVPWKLVAVVVVLVGTFWTGWHYGRQGSDAVIARYGAKVTDLQNKIQTLDKPAQQKIITKYVTKIVHVKDVGAKNETIAKTIVPSSCELSNGWVSTHDAAATGNEVDTRSASDATGSGIKDTEALATVTGNYATYNALKAQLDALQASITEHNNAVDAANKAVKKKHWWQK